jgi:acetylornithine deacetylase/succinyl-diaminopimelate desuccinylase-like protein
MLRFSRPSLAFSVLVSLATLLASPSVPRAAAAQQDAVAAARAYRQAHEVEILESFSELLRQPNYGGDLEDITELAGYLEAQFEARGVEVELLRLPDVPPLIYGEIMVPGATRTLGFYVHYDGQPATGRDWINGPYEPVLYSGRMDLGGEPIGMPVPGGAVELDWRIYARSASDDKAPLAALLAALDALQGAGISLTSNIKFLFEGEEEIGSPHLGEYIEAYGDKLGVDLWLFCDGPVHQTGAPQIVFGVRGVTSLDLTVYGPARPLHSGHYGGWAPVPGQMLAELLASMKDADGNVVVEGFYDTVVRWGRAEREALERLPVPDEQLRADLGLGWTEGEESLAERLFLPSLTVKGLASGSVGADARNVIPDRAEAALGLRLVKGNDPEAMLDLVEAHIERQGFHIVREDPDMVMRARFRKLVKVIRGDGYPAARTDMGLPVVEEVVDAVRAATHQTVLMVPALGGSLPLYLFTENMAAPALILPIANHDNNQHASNENIRLANLWYGIDLYASLLTMR